MPKVKCRHCGVSVTIASGFAGMFQCPSCSRSTQHPPASPTPNLPPPASDRRKRDQDEARGSGGCTLAIAAVCLLVGGVFAVRSITMESDMIGIREAGVACFCAIAARIFQAAAYSQWK